MTGDPAAARYAQALFESAKADGALDETLAQLTLLEQLIQGETQLQRLLLNPELATDEKVALLERVFQGAWSPLVEAFVRMVIAADRVMVLPDIVEAFRMVADDERKILRAVVRSAHPLLPGTVHRIRTVLEQREARQVLLTSEVDASLVGGFQLLLGHRVLDSSVRHTIDDLRQRLSSARVV